MSAPAPEVSHGRGGVGNISPDDTVYVDGEIVREGVAGSHGDGAFSTGRGGAANIGDAGKAAAARTDKDVVPDAAMVPKMSSEYHTGRGGAGNEHTDKTDEETKKKVSDGPMSVADKLKGKIFGIFKK